MEIILYGNGKDDKFAGKMTAALSCRYSTLFIGKGILSSKGEGTSITIFEETKSLSATSDKCLIILRERADLSKLNLINKDIPILVYSDNRKQISALSKKGFRAISCGLLEKDALNFSSLGENFSMIALQRNLNCFKKIIEPMDIPILHPKEFAPYLLLSLAAISLFLEAPSELKLDFTNAITWQ